VAFELGYRTQPIKDVSVDIAAFYNNYDRLRTLHTGAPISTAPLIIPITWGNGVSGDTLGGEVSATVRVSDTWRLQGSYSLLDARFGSPDPEDLSTANGLAGSAPRNQAQIHSYLDLTRDLQLNVGLSYVGGVPEFNVPSYVSTDVNLVWKPKDSLEFSVGVTNLFDSHHPEFGVTGGQGVASETPRTFYAQVTYKF
jgi:iron complex outermembrane receptor protein